MTDTLGRRLPPEERKQHILDVAVRLAADTGYLSLTRDAVAKAAGVSPGLLTWYYLHIDHLRAAVMQAAVEQGILSVVAEGLACRVPGALSAPAELRAAAVASLI
jgi:AcrR family transcriptional regulator